MEGKMSMKEHKQYLNSLLLEAVNSIVSVGIKTVIMKITDREYKNFKKKKYYHINVDLLKTLSEVVFPVMVVTLAMRV